MTFLLMALFVITAGGAVFAFSGGNDTAKKRVAAVARPEGKARGRAATPQQDAAARRKNVAVMLKDIEKNKQREKPTLRRRLEQAGFFKTSPRAYWITSAILGLSAGFTALVTGQKPLVIGLAIFAIGLGFPRWVLGFLARRRMKKFTTHFATAIDVIVRSVRSGLPVNEALRIVAKESPEPVRSEFNKLVEGLKVGVTMEQGLVRMRESMPTSEVGFFAIVMTIQSKAGGNLSEALGNLASVLRDRKRLQGKIQAMSSEAKASAMIIGSLPPAVMGLVYLTTPGYMKVLFTERMGNLLLAGCVLWMSIGCLVMRKMINFKH
ncbi:MAG: type II secretion system F family protein [Alphaproteobacteria bacterium]|nr:type II secretion system F family protein [Alphaproteobacteria bacterium]